MAKSKKNWGGARKGAGRRTKPIEARAVVNGHIAIRIDEATALALQQLMLRAVEGVSTPEDMIRYLVLKELNAQRGADAEGSI